MTGRADERLFNRAAEHGGDSPPITEGRVAVLQAALTAADIKIPDGTERVPGRGFLTWGELSDDELAEEYANLLSETTRRHIGGDNEQNEDDDDNDDVVVAAEPRPVLPGKFWGTTEQLKHIHRAADFYNVSPAALLAVILTRTAAEDKWTHRIRNDGPPMNTALYNIVVSPSGTTKSKALQVAEHITRYVGGHLPERNRWESLSTPEGMLLFYLEEQQHQDDNDDGGRGGRKWIQTRFQTCAYVDELVALQSKAQSAGNWILECLSSSYTGHWNARNTISRPMPAPAAHTHCGLYAGIQDAPAAEMMFGRNKQQGLTNRFLLFNGLHDYGNEQTDIGEEPAPLTIRLPDCPPGHCGPDKPRPVREHPNIRKEIHQHNRAALKGDTGGRSSHYMLVRRKTANALRLLHEHDRIEEQDWQLAGMLCDHSDDIRRWLEDNHEQFVIAEHKGNIALTTAKDRAIRNDRIEEQRTLAGIHERLMRKHPEGITRTIINRTMNGREKNRLSPKPTERVLAWLWQHGWLYANPEQIRSGGLMPWRIPQSPHFRNGGTGT